MASKLDDAERGDQRGLDEGLYTAEKYSYRCSVAVSGPAKELLCRSSPASGDTVQGSDRNEQ